VYLFAGPGFNSHWWAVVDAKSVLRAIDSRLGRIERRSLKSIQVASVLDSVRQVASLADEVIAKARCLSESSGCRDYDGGRLCTTGCGGVSLVEAGGETTVYKYGGGSLSVKASAGELLVASKDVSITVKPGEVVVRLPGSSGAREIAVKLDDEDELLRKGYMVKLGTRKLATALARSLNAVTHCIESRRLQC
jgi:hypothetical protein